ncbi:MAG: hypothetical protein IPH13_11020 [Planctomycetes bacterium]|nr:hypothetical protein [Planctomycetota bacterium]MCC7171814.1 hypothetical protein [Planctomycetota bacterium]
MGCSRGPDSAVEVDVGGVADDDLVIERGVPVADWGAAAERTRPCGIEERTPQRRYFERGGHLSG